MLQAKLAQQAERYDDMAAGMKTLTQQAAGVELSHEERDLLSEAYKKAVGARLKSWQIVSSIEKKTTGSSDEKQLVQLITDYRGKIEKEIRDICGDVLVIITLFSQ